MSDSPKQEQITIELFNGLCEAMDISPCDPDAVSNIVARSTALMGENAKLKKLLEEAYEKLDKLKIQRCPLFN